MSAYCTAQDILAEISTADVLAMVDDTQTGDIGSAACQSMLNTVIQRASARIDARIANIYDVPISPVIAAVRDCATTFACESLYRRRLTPDEKNPFKTDADNCREWLKGINKGEIHLDLTVPRDFPQGAVNTTPLAMNYNTNSM